MYGKLVMNENVFGNVLGEIDWMWMDWKFENCMGMECLIWMNAIGWLWKVMNGKCNWMLRLEFEWYWVCMEMV